MEIDVYETSGTRLEVINFDLKRVSLGSSAPRILVQHLGVFRQYTPGVLDNTAQGFRQYSLFGLF